ncbi:hypothetical protein TNCV_503241 [Trichonephila clavipes]|nr:hypothetical protein TNCV_503241 [Trichonephila clavipes]
MVYRHTITSLSGLKESIAEHNIPQFMLLSTIEHVHLQGVLPQNWGGTDLNRTVTCTVFTATANDRRTSSSLP